MCPVFRVIYKEWTLPVKTLSVRRRCVLAGEAEQGNSPVAHERKAKMNPKRQMGRPRLPSQDARSNRLVTFVTDRDIEYLTQVTIDEERSMAFVIPVET